MILCAALASDSQYYVPLSRLILLTGVGHIHTGSSWYLVLLFPGGATLERVMHSLFSVFCR